MKKVVCLFLITATLLLCLSSCELGTIEKEYSEGLEYELCTDSRNGDYYIVTGIGTCADVDIVIPATYEGLPVKKIGNIAFSKCNTVNSVLISEGVTEIGQQAFVLCENLKSVQLPDTLAKIDEEAFAGCYSLSSCNIPAGVKTIAPGAFRLCTSLKSIEVDKDNLCYQSINGDLYYSDDYADQFNMDGIPLIAYAPGKTETHVSLLEEVSAIANYAFAGNTYMESIFIPVKVTEISGDAFLHCSSLTDVYYSGTEEEWEAIKIVSKGNDALQNATIHYNYIPEE